MDTATALTTTATATPPTDDDDALAALLFRLAEQEYRRCLDDVDSAAKTLEPPANETPTKQAVCRLWAEKKALEEALRVMTARAVLAELLVKGYRSQPHPASPRPPRGEHHD